MRKVMLMSVLMGITSFAIANEPVTPADMPAEAQNQMYSIITDYNKCMMQSRLKHSHDGESAQANAQAIMNACEDHIDQLKAHLTANNVNPALVEGMGKHLRSQGARQLMARAMNNLAAQAAARSNAETMEQKAE